jgi:hypothetical protein
MTERHPVVFIHGLKVHEGVRRQATCSRMTEAVSAAVGLG